MVGYSGTPLRQKLGIKDDSRVFLLNPPPGLAHQLAIDNQLEGSLDVAVAFCNTLRGLQAAWHEIEPRMVANGGLWIAWPKKASKVASELDDNIVRTDGLARNWVDNKVCAISEVYSGLRFVIPLDRR